jgi:hypothetical protein
MAIAGIINGNLGYYGFPSRALRVAIRSSIGGCVAKSLETAFPSRGDSIQI